MAKLIEFDTPDGQIQIAVRTPEDTITAVGVLDEVTEKVQKSLEDVFSIVIAISNAVRAALARAPEQPSSAEIEFGLQFTGKGTVYVVETQAQASMKVKLAYKRA